MNKRAQKTVFGFALVILFFIFMIGAFATIEPMKEFLNDARDSTSLNCKGTDNFNQTAFDEDTTFQRLVRRPTCFVTGLTLVYFIGAFLIAAIVWLVKSWGKLK